MSARADHLRAVLAGVIGATARALDARGVVVLDDGSPEARLLQDWLADVPALSIASDALSDGGAPPAAPDEPIGDVATDVQQVEYRRYRARLAAAATSAIVAHPINKTALLLGDMPPPEPLLPLGDVYASDVATLADGWSAPARVRALAERAGGIHALDGLLARLLGEPRPGHEAATADPDVVESIRVQLAAGRHWRRYRWIVPKIGARTVGIDLFE